MYAQVENNPRDRFKKPVYWIVFLVFLCSLVPWQKMPEYWQESWERAEKEAFFPAKEVDEAWKLYDEVSSKAKALGKNYGPENFFQDRNVLVPLRIKFGRAISYEGKSAYPDRTIISLSDMCDGLVSALHQKALENFPRYSPETLKLSPKEHSKNQAIWWKAETEAPAPEGCGPIHISGWAFLRFCKWVGLTYLKFLPFALVLILFQLWRQRQPLLQELVLRPGFFLSKVLEGPIGVAIYSGIKPAIEWQFAKLCANYMRQHNKWRLTDEEEKTLWLEACEKAEITPEIIVQKSKLALATSYLLVILSAPFVAISGAGFQQKPVEQASIQTFSWDQGREKPTNQWFMFVVDAISPAVVELPRFEEPAARVKNIVLPTIVAEHGWFLPPILAPPLRRR